MNLEIGTPIPIGLFNKRLAVLAMQGAGKTYLAGVIEEEMLDYLLAQKETNAKLIIIDPVGAHWGIREKYPIHIIGGDHGDIEVDMDSGRLFARMVNETNISVLFDLSQMEMEDMIEFVSKFLKETFQITKTPTHIILEEADMFAPQRSVTSNQKYSSAAVDSIVRRGRGRGLGMTMITQRPAVLSKNVLTQVDASIILNVTGQRDLETIKEHLDSSGLGKTEINDHIEKIMKFQKGQALLFSPSWLKRTEVIKIRERISFHAGAEPELGKPDPSLKITLIEMRKDLLIHYLNGDTESLIKILKSDAPRENVWTTKQEILEEPVEIERSDAFEYNFGTTKKKLRSWAIMITGAAFLFWVMTLL